MKMRIFRFKTFNSVLAECLDAVRSGDDVESCLARYSHHADRLRPLLTLSERIAATPQPKPRAAAQAVTWNALRQRAEALREGRDRPRWRITWLRPIAVAASLVIAILAATGGTVYAAQDSLPDSPLYRVKLASEDVRLWLVFDDLDKATMLLDQADERAEEIKALLERDKSVGGNVLSALRNRTERASRIIENRPQETTLRLRLLDQSETQENLLLALWDSVPESGQDELAEAVALLHSTRLENTGAMASIEPGFLAGGVLDISGLVQHETGSIWTVGGVEIRVDERTIGRRNLREDQTARFLVARSLSGRLHALDITEIDPAQPPLNALVSGAVEEVEEDQIRVAGQWINISDDTLFKLKVQEGLRVKMVVNTGVSGAVASEIDLADISSAAADAPVLTYEGAIEGEVATDGEINEWSIGGRTFVITPATVVDARAGDVAAGSRAYVEAANKDGHVRGISRWALVYLGHPDPAGTRSRSTGSRQPCRVGG
jgi:hypothetical protein